MHVRVFGRRIALNAEAGRDKGEADQEPTRQFPRAAKPPEMQGGIGASQREGRQHRREAQAGLVDFSHSSDREASPSRHSGCIRYPNDRAAQELPEAFQAPPCGRDCKFVEALTRGSCRRPGHVVAGPGA
jgi:hypothetical protein